MELFFFGTAIGMLIGLILVGVFAKDGSVCKRTHDGDSSSNGDNSGYFGESDGMDRHNNPPPEEIIHVLNAMRLILGLSRTDKEYLVHAINYISEKEGLN